jgi:hypothetical protein
MTMMTTFRAGLLRVGLFSVASLLLLGSVVTAQKEDGICRSADNTFTFKLNYHASELGYYEIEECEGVNPTIGMEIGQTYKFVQADPTNYYHPLGFAYFPDGAHDGVDELEPGISLGNDTCCTETLSCPAPMYFLNDKYLGTYSNQPGILAATVNEDDIGLDLYERRFFHPITQWIQYGTFHVQLKFDDATYGKDLFYFCHVSAMK